MAYVRCRKCRGRRTLSRHPDEYLRKPPRCRTPGCKSHDYTVDTYRTRRERGPKAPRPCRCYNYSFPHRRSGGYCCHNHNLTEDMMREREECGAWA